MNRFSTSPWFAVAVGAVAALVAELLTDSMLISVLVAASVGLLGAAIAAILGRRETSRDGGTTDSTHHG
jgi:hypothetical protein